MQALQATAQRYSPEEVAVRAVPSLAPLAVDPIAQVGRGLPLLSYMKSGVALNPLAGCHGTSSCRSGLLICAGPPDRFGSAAELPEDTFRQCSRIG